MRRIVQINLMIKLIIKVINKKNNTPTKKIFKTKNFKLHQTYYERNTKQKNGFNKKINGIEIIY